MILSNFVSFYKSLIDNDKFPVRLLARLQKYDEMSVLGRCLSKLSLMYNVDRSRLSAKMVKEKLCYRPMPAGKAWPVEIVRELMESRDQQLVIPGFDNDNIMEMLDSICSS